MFHTLAARSLIWDVRLTSDEQSRHRLRRFVRNRAGGVLAFLPRLQAERVAGVRVYDSRCRPVSRPRGLVIVEFTSSFRPSFTGSCGFRLLFLAGPRHSRLH